MAFLVTSDSDSRQGVEIQCGIDKTADLGLVTVMVGKCLQAHEVLLVIVHGTDAGAHVDRHGARHIAGWSDRIFDILHAIENGSTAIEQIRQIQL